MDPVTEVLTDNMVVSRRLSIDAHAAGPTQRCILRCRISRVTSRRACVFNDAELQRRELKARRSRWYHHMVSPTRLGPAIYENRWSEITVGTLIVNNYTYGSM